MTQPFSIEEVAERLRHSKDTGRSATVLIGAGCSVKAGIPLASEFVAIIEQEFQHAYNRAESKTYSGCMEALDIGQRRDLIGRYIENAKLNWAHIALAQLVKCGFVGRVLTTNFDPLVVKACALIGEFPSVYDIASSKEIRSMLIAPKAICYLHGQNNGFFMSNTHPEFDDLEQSIRPLFEETAFDRPWLIVGYSGEVDPVFEQLVSPRQYQYGAFWSSYPENEAPQHVKDNFLTKDGGHIITGYDADDFFVLLARSLGCFPPNFIETPFSFLRETISTVAPYSVPGQPYVLSDEPIKRVEHAISKFEVEEPSKLLEAQSLMMGAEYQKAFETLLDIQGPLTLEATDLKAWAQIMQGNTLATQAKMKSGHEADRLFAEAGGKYAAALEVKPDKHEALYNWGNALLAQAEMKKGDEADNLLAEAGKKYAAALAIKPDKPEALGNWGNVLLARASMKNGVEADGLFAEAVGKFRDALEINPDLHEALNSWGYALGAQAEMKRGKEADRLFAEAGEKFMAALAIKPDKHEVFNNWGNAISAQARMKSGEEANRLFVNAGEKYAAALTHKPDMHDALYNWGNALSAQAEMNSGEEADHLIIEAGHKYLAALSLKPDMHEALNNWGSAFSIYAERKSGEDADRLFAEAKEKFAAALVLKPNMHLPLRNFGDALAAQAKMKSGEEADSLLIEAGQKYAAALKLKPDDYHALSSWGDALAKQAEIKSGEEATKLLALAEEKREAARRLQNGD